MHAANICTKNYANGKKSQVKTTWRSHLPTVNRIYQQLSATARLYAVRTSPARSPHADRTPLVPRTPIARA